MLNVGKVEFTVKQTLRPLWNNDRKLIYYPLPFWDKLSLKTQKINN